MVLTLADSNTPITLYSDQRLEIHLAVPVPSGISPAQDNMSWSLVSNSTPRVLATQSYVIRTQDYQFNDANDSSLWSYESSYVEGTGFLSEQDFSFLPEASSRWNYIPNSSTTLTFHLNGNSVSNPAARDATFTINVIQVP